ncbi:hypothetical protein [Sessilibacter sp. MAH2]
MSLNKIFWVGITLSGIILIAAGLFVVPEFNQTATENSVGRDPTFESESEQDIPVIFNEPIYDELWCETMMTKAGNEWQEHEFVAFGKHCTN